MVFASHNTFSEFSEPSRSGVVTPLQLDQGMNRMFTAKPFQVSIGVCLTEDVEQLMIPP